MAARYLADLRESAPIYAEEGLVHPRDDPAQLQFRASAATSCSGPWIHAGSRIQHLAAAAVGGTLSARARITGNYEHKGHRFVEVDVLVLADEAPVAHVAHLAIYQPRQVVGA